MRSSQPMPSFVIDTCPSDDTQKPLETCKQSTTNQLRSWSLPNCNETYKDLHGAIHYSFSNQLNNILKRSRSYPNNYLFIYSKLQENFPRIQSPSTFMSVHMNYLDPNGGTQTPGGASSRYSLYGSFFDLSESGYYPASDQQLIKSDNKLLTIDGRPLLIVDHSTHLATNTYQDKCMDWLHHIQTNSS
ncbi:unnamed protein product [Adineta steineri]|uniref:Uncharacterized protein n=1 Tax=Adineta steineri TaxID=433720 RepID=A0A813MC75_9BILA|nr:unnamed protein product [Adineta steineri]CAF3479044.1 unnamed protein product [Adineta steineri]